MIGLLVATILPHKPGTSDLKVHARYTHVDSAAIDINRGYSQCRDDRVYLSRMFISR